MIVEAAKEAIREAKEAIQVLQGRVKDIEAHVLALEQPSKVWAKLDGIGWIRCSSYHEGLWTFRAEIKKEAKTNNDAQVFFCSWGKKRLLKRMTADKISVYLPGMTAIVRYAVS